MNKLEKLREKLKSGAGLESSGPGPAPAPVKAPKLSPVKTEKPPTEKDPKPKVEYITDPDRAAEVIAGLPNDTVLGLDIETMKDPDFKNHPQAGLCPHLSKIRLVQICPAPSIVYVFDVMKMAMGSLNDLWTRKFAAHEAVFEIKHLYHNDIVLDHIECTLLQYNSLYGGRPSLKDIAKKHMSIDISKQEQTSDWSLHELSEEQIHYAAIDAWVVRITSKNLGERIVKQKREAIYALMRNAQHAVAKIEYYGVNFDAVMHMEVVEQLEQEFEAAEKALRDVIGPDVLLSSTKQLSDFYKANLAKTPLKKWAKTKSGDLKMNKFTVPDFAHIDKVAPLAEYKKLGKLLGSFGKSLLDHINPKTGRIHSSFTLAGAKSGRFACSKPNVQQTPRDKAFRGLFKAPDGRVLIIADYSQVELRVLAILSNDSTMLTAYKTGDDLHRLTASKITNTSIDEVTDEQRRLAKAVNFGLVFGMGAAGLAKYARNTYGVIMTPKQAKAARDAYFKTYPGVVTWQEKVTRKSNKYIKAVTKTGRVVSLEPDSVYTQSKNIPVQGSAAEVMLAALHILDQEITRQQLDIKIVCIVHDEIHLEVPESLAEHAKALLEECMVAGMLAIFPEAHIKNLVEAKIGNSWGDAK